MNKEKFLNELQANVTFIPQYEKERIMNYYNESIEDAIEDGMSEEKAVASMGSIPQIIEQIKLEHEPIIKQNVGQTQRGGGIERKVLLFITSPFWLTAIALIITGYLLYITSLLVIVAGMMALIAFVLMGLLNITWVILANFASGLVLLGCILLSLGILPWLWWLLGTGLHYAKILYTKCVASLKSGWQKAVAS